MNDNIAKAILIFGGAFAAFILLKPKEAPLVAAAATPTKSFDADDKYTPKPSREDAEIVANAYVDAMRAGEPPTKLNELNKECMKEFGMRAYIDAKDDKLIVCDKAGNIILEK